MDKYTNLFKALSDETRLRILHILIVAEKELCACEFTDVLEVTTYNISKHIKILKNANLIKERKEGRWVYYSIKIDKTTFTNHIQKAISEMENAQLKKDIKELEKRLKLRIDDTCPIEIGRAHV